MLRSCSVSTSSGNRGFTGPDCPLSVSRFFQLKPRINLLVGGDVMIEPGVKSVGIGRYGLEDFIVIAAAAGDVGQRVISIEQIQRNRIQHRFRNGVIRKWRAVVGIDGDGRRQAGGGTDDGKAAQVAVALRQRRHKILFRTGRSAAIALVIDEEKGLVPAAIKMRNGDGSAETAAKRIESLGRLDW